MPPRRRNFSDPKKASAAGKRGKAAQKQTIKDPKAYSEEREAKRIRDRNREDKTP